MSPYPVYLLCLFAFHSVHSGPIAPELRHGKKASISHESELLLRQIGISDDVQVLTVNGTEGCQVNDEFYLEGADLPTHDPCEYCVCKPPGLACEVIKCDHKPGCRSLQRAGLCCPEYICDCEQEGVIYGNTDPVVSKDPCMSCFCVTGSITCSIITCLDQPSAGCNVTRKEEECCPTYSNCPEPALIEEVIAVDVEDSLTTEIEIPTTEMPLIDHDETLNLIEPESDPHQVEILEETELFTMETTVAPTVVEEEKGEGDVPIIEQEEVDLTINEIIPQFGVEELHITEEGASLGTETFDLDIADQIEVDVIPSDKLTKPVITEDISSLHLDEIEEASLQTELPQTGDESIITEISIELKGPLEETYAIQEEDNEILTSIDVSGSEDGPKEPALIAIENDIPTEATKYNAIIFPDEKLTEAPFENPLEEVYAIQVEDNKILTSIDVSVPEDGAIKSALLAIENEVPTEAPDYNAIIFSDEKITEAPAEDSKQKPDEQLKTETEISVEFSKLKEVPSFEDNEISPNSDNSDLSNDDNGFWMSMLQNDVNDGKENLKASPVRINDKLASIDDEDLSTLSISYESKKQIPESEIVANNPKAELKSNYALHTPVSSSKFSGIGNPALFSIESLEAELKTESEFESEATTAIDDVETVTESYEHQIILKSSIQTSPGSDQIVISEKDRDSKHPPTHVKVPESEILEKDTRNTFHNPEELEVTTVLNDDEITTDSYSNQIILKKSSIQTGPMSDQIAINEEDRDSIYPPTHVNVPESEILEKDTRNEFPAPEELEVTTVLDEDEITTESYGDTIILKKSSIRKSDLRYQIVTTDEENDSKYPPTHVGVPESEILEKDTRKESAINEESEVTTVLDDVEIVTESYPLKNILRISPVQENSEVTTVLDDVEIITESYSMKHILKISPVQENSLSDETSIDDENASKFSSMNSNVLETEILEKDNRNEVLDTENLHTSTVIDDLEVVTENYIANIILKTAPTQENPSNNRISIEEKIDSNNPPTNIKVLESEILKKDKRNEENAEILNEERNEIYRDNETESPNLATESPNAMSGALADINQDIVIGPDEDDMYWINMLKVNDTLQNKKLKESKVEELITTLSPTQPQTEPQEEVAFKSEIEHFTEFERILETTVSPQIREEDIDTQLPSESIVNEIVLKSLPSLNLIRKSSPNNNDKVELNPETAETEIKIDSVEPTLKKTLDSELDSGVTQIKDDILETTKTKSASPIKPFHILKRKRKLDTPRLIKVPSRKRPTRFDVWKTSFLTSGRNEFQSMNKNSPKSKESPEDFNAKDMGVLMNPLDLHFLKIAKKYGLRPLTTRRNINLKQRRKDLWPKRQNAN